MNRSVSALNDIRQNAQYALDFINGVQYHDFEADVQRQYAVIRALEICGEAAKRVTEETRQAYPGIEWKLLAGMRDRLIHGYDIVNPAIVWRTVTCDMPIILQALAGINPVIDA